jgi:hypothetical protein
LGLSQIRQHKFFPHNTLTTFRVTITGGATHFPKATPAVLRNSGAGDGSGKVVKGDGVRIWPRRGRALVFWSVRGGVEDARSLHEAESVVQGEKWIATKWLQVAERCG